MYRIRFALLSLIAASPLWAQPRPLAVIQSRFKVAAGGRIVLDAPPEAVAFMRSAAARTAKAPNRVFAVAPELKGSRVILGVPLTTEPGEYDVALSFSSKAQEERTTTVHLTVTPFAQPEATSATPPVVLLDGIQLALDGSCPISTDSSGTFGNMEKYLLASPNNVPNVYFFENCAECPKCAIEKLGDNLATFLKSLAAPQVDVVVHSMGGLIVRSYLAGKSTTSGVFNPPANPKIRKAVFLATPHFGSPLADEITTNALLSQLYGGDPQIIEMQRASQFQWDLATWNQFGDDLRGVDAVAAVGNAGPSPAGAPQQSDGTVDVTSASLEFAVAGRTRVIPYCHIGGSDLGGLAGAITGCTVAGIAFIDSPAHPSFQIVSSFLLDTPAWQSVGSSVAQDATLSHFGGVMVGQVSASGQYVQTLRTVTFGSTALADGVTAGELFYNDFVPAGTASFSLTALDSSAATCGPVTAKAGLYSTIRCKASPSITAVGPLATGAAKVVGSGGSITITGVGFGAQQCASCGVTASSKPLQVSNWSDISITASLPGSYSGFVTIGVTTAGGSDAINIMAVPNSAFPSVVISGVTNAASGAIGAVAPGELVAIYGTGLGPSIGVSFAVNPATGGVDTTLAGTRVLFGSVAAPILYASATQVNAIVPYEVAGQKQVAMVVQSAAGSASQTVQIAGAAPGAFTVGSTGSGQAAAVNLSDGTLNGSTHPAPKGSYVSIYFTGGGQTDPPGVTGSITAPVLKWLTQAVSVTVGNQPVTAQFYGAAPTYVDGLNQLNILLPSSVPSGAQPLVITVGGISSPSTATIYVQ